MSVGALTWAAGIILAIVLGLTETTSWLNAIIIGVLVIVVGNLTAFLIAAWNMYRITKNPNRF